MQVKVNASCSQLCFGWALMKACCGSVWTFCERPCLWSTDWYTMYTMFVLRAAGCVSHMCVRCRLGCSQSSSTRCFLHGLPVHWHVCAGCSWLQPAGTVHSDRSTVCTPPVVHRCVCSVVLCVGPTYLLISITNHGLACSPSLLRLTISCGKTNVCR